MAHIIKDIEYKARCKNCHRMVGFDIHDVVSTYERGLDGLRFNDYRGWFDGDAVWHYVICPKCNHSIYVGDILSKDDISVCNTKFYNRDIES